MIPIFTCLMFAAVQDLPTSTLLFDPGKDTYPRFRIPALITTTKGAVLAFCEGRKGGRGLTGDIDLVVRRSSDSGKTWTPLAIALAGDGHTLGNPCPVVDSRNGTIWLAFTRSHGMDTEEAIVAGTSREATRVFVTHSKDDGKTWAKPTDISATCRADNWTWYGTGPGVGIQLANGRLVIPSYHAEAKTKTYRSHMIFSDDAGKTWKRGETVGSHCTECQVAQRKDGSLLMISRTIQGKQEKTTALSSDGGATWGKPKFEPALYDPSCQASLLRIPGRWLFTHPAGPGRRDLVLRISDDEGRTWGAGRLLRKGDSQYSSLTLLPDGAIGCLYDCWVDGNYRVFFTRFELD